MPQKAGHGEFRELATQLIAYRSASLHVTPGIDGRIVHADFVMDVRACGASADTCVPDDFTALNPRSWHRGERREMCVPGADAESMVQHNQASIARVVFRDGHDAVRGGVNGSAVIRGHINAGVERAFTAERIQPLSERVRDMSHHGPD